MKQVLFNRQQTNLAQCISDGTIYFVKDSNGNFTQLALGDGSKSHVVGIGPKMDDATKQELMSKLGLTISTDMGTIHLGQLSPASGASAQKTVIYERNLTTASYRYEVANVDYVQQYMKAAQALVYTGLLNASNGEISSYNSALIPGGKLEGGNYTYIQVQGGETNVEVGDMIIITDVRHVGTEGDTPAHNEASIIIVQNNLDIFSGSSSVSDWQNGEGVTKAKQVYAFVESYVETEIPNIIGLADINKRLTQLESRATTIEGNIDTINGEISTIKSDLAEGKYHISWEGE